MHYYHWTFGKGANMSRKSRLMRRAATLSTTKYASGGRRKVKQPKAVTLPALKFLEGRND